MTEGTVVQWFKKVGDAVERGEILAEIETDKANVELEAFESGTLLKLVANEGDLVPVGEVIALLGAEGESVDGPVESHAPKAETRRGTGEARSHDEAPGAARPAAPEPRKATPSDGDRVRISPVARRLAADNDIDVSALTGSGPDGRILRRDVEAALEAPSSATEGKGREKADERAPRPVSKEEEPTRAARPTGKSTAGVEPLSRIRQTIARRMSQSKQQQPHYYLTVDADMTDALAFRAQINASLPEDARVTVNDLIVKACALALTRHPKFTAVYTDEGLKFGDAVNIDIGVALDEGLIAPSLLDCDSKSLGQIAKDSKGLVERARTGKLKSDEYGAGVFTITNLGAYGVEALIGIINPPQAAILGVGSVMQAAVVRDGAIVVRSMMKLALSADHRVTDGAEGARFIKEIQGILEAPAQLAL
jgi:pyruvate dehydrogenase E2 component (dihydrolipoamide acetyltransferase)